ncbi:unnamed protein product, partial [Urochloa humidicola]
YGWLYSLVFYVPLDLIKIPVRYTISGKAWNLLLDRKTALAEGVLRSSSQQLNAALSDHRSGEEPRCDRQVRRRKACTKSTCEVSNEVEACG